MRRASRVVVVGAGVTGLSAAALAARRLPGVDITLIDAGVRPEWAAENEVDLRVSAIAPGSVQLLDDIGAWSIVHEARVSAYDHMRVWDQNDEPGGPTTLAFDADEVGVAHLGYIVENRLLQHALLAVLDDTGVTLRFAAPLQSLSRADNGFSVALEGGDALHADLVIGADGARSMVRDCAGIAVERHAYEQVAFVTHLECETPHNNTAWQRFLRDGPIGVLPLNDGRISVVWSTTAEKAERAWSATDDDLGRILTDATDAVLGNLRVAGPRGRFPLAAQHARDYVQQGLVLIGDAAHTVHPLAGQGANLGFADVEALIDTLAAAVAEGEHIGDRPVLRRYERRRKGANATMMHFLTGLNRLFAADSAVLGELRRAGFALFNRSGPIRRHATSVALGRH